jgi:hypothetical protein
MPALTSGIGRRGGDDGQAAVPARGSDQLFHRLAPQQRNVAVEHQHQLPGKAGQGRHREPHGVPGPALLGLLDDGDRALAEPRRQGRFDRVALVPQHRHHRLGADRLRQRDGIGGHRPPEQLVQHLGPSGTHPRPLSRGQDDRGQSAALAFLAFAFSFARLLRFRRHAEDAHP